MKRSPMPARKTPLRAKAWWKSSAPRRRRTTSRSKGHGGPTSSQARRLIIERDRFCVFGRCSSKISDVHHRLPRGMGGARYDETVWAYSRLVGLCTFHHGWVESNRTRARDMGLLVRHVLVACDQVPVLHHDRWVLLDDHGCVLPCDPPEGWSE